MFAEVLIANQPFLQKPFGHWRKSCWEQPTNVLNVASEVTLQKIALLKPIQNRKMKIFATGAGAEDITFQNAMHLVTLMGESYTN